jgi:hypothetical protein
MENYHVTIMSIDPDDHYGREQGDDHQKYGLSVQATSEKDALDKGAAKFKSEHPSLPIFWVKAFKN